MDALKTYLEATSQQHLASLLGCSQGLISHWMTGRLRITPERAVQIEQATGGAVSRHDLRPDLFGSSPAQQAAA